jgi:thiol-disulfide isomerase/thioredoxin
MKSVWHIVFVSSLLFSGSLFAKQKEGVPVEWTALSRVHLGTKKDQRVLAKPAKLYLVDFWASWCAPCRKSFPFLDSLQKEYGSEGLVVLGISLDTDIKEALGFSNSIKVSYDLYHDQERNLKQRLEIPAIPFVYFLSPMGEILAQHRGFKEGAEAEIRATLKKLMSKAE